MQPKQTPTDTPPAPFSVPESVATSGAVQTTAPPAVPAPTSSSLSAPAVADDGDVIEPEWVAKVKHLIGSTHGDPYEQSRQFSLLKADYMQKRYGKVIKAEE